jgi:Heparinase II/III-like protein
MDSVDPDVLSGIVAERPRLMATKSEVARTRRLIQQNATAMRWHREVEKQADLLLDLPPLTPSWVHDPRETGAAPLPLVRPPKSTDGPAAPLDIARLFCLRIQTLGIMWLLTLDPRYRNRAKAELLAVCAFPDWAGDKFLVTAETAFGAAIGYDWLYDSLCENERGQVAQAIAEKAIQAGLDEFDASRPPRWKTAAVNWCLVCNGALMIAALSVAEFDPRRAARLFSLCRASISTGVAEYRPDGGWAEGPGYWHYATQYAIYLLDSLSTALHTDLGLDTSPGLSKTGFFRLHAAGPSGKLFNFADGEEDHSGGYWLFWLAKRYHHPLDAWIERHGRKVHPMDLLWFEEDAGDLSRIPTAGRFRAVDAVMLRGSWDDPKTTYLGIKGGANDACEHGHYDLGSFVLDANGVRWAMDLGPDDYGLPGYFEREMRSRYYRTSTIGHNTIVINGECQPATARAVITRESFGEDISFVVMDLSAAYPSAASAGRGFALIDRRHVLIVDEIAPTGCLSSVVWQMHTAAHVGLGDAMASLIHPAQSDSAEPSRFYVRIIDPGSGTLSLGSAAPSEPQGQSPNAGVAKLVFRIEQVAQPARVAVLLSPDPDVCANPELPVVLQRRLSDWV